MTSVDRDPGIHDTYTQIRFLLKSVIFWLLVSATLFMILFLYNYYVFVSKTGIYWATYGVDTNDVHIFPAMMSTSDLEKFLVEFQKVQISVQSYSVVELQLTTLERIRYAKEHQLTAHRVSGLPILQPEFAILPPRFTTSDEEVQRAKEICFPGLPQIVGFVAEFALASLIYHIDFLRQRYQMIILCSSLHYLPTPS
ncbi:hypothetical protein PHMEG_0003975 [Phytophthora megakarya]|uniref:Uncharacterized protein n=1 Tax=Phytophthora megakarya TaxID=4795 RepID=A0A225WV25_9STRA|nr:hypothetical protein PHMEG_0003975 [Phytophthora megakarya]